MGRESSPDFMLENILAYIVPEVVLRRAVVVRGCVVLSGSGSLVVEDCLFDSGAIHASFIRKDFVDAHRDVLREFIFPADGAARHSRAFLGTVESACCV